MFTETTKLQRKKWINHPPKIIKSSPRSIQVPECDISCENLLYISLDLERLSYKIYGTAMLIEKSGTLILAVKSSQCQRHPPESPSPPENSEGSPKKLTRRASSSSAAPVSVLSLAANSNREDVIGCANWNREWRHVRIELVWCVFVVATSTDHTGRDSG